jgi:hypothetical protein
MGSAAAQVSEQELNASESELQWKTDGQRSPTESGRLKRSRENDVEIDVVTSGLSDPVSGSATVNSVVSLDPVTV